MKTSRNAPVLGLIAILCLAIGSLALASQASPALAQTGNWNAMAVDPDSLTVGYARNQASQSQASAEAMTACRNSGGTGCRTAMTRQGGCLAISRNRSGTSLGIGMEGTIQATVVRALDECLDGGKYAHCTVHTNFCSGE